MLKQLFRYMLYPLLRPLYRWAEARLEKRTLKAAKRKSPVKVTVSSRGGMRPGVYVNGVRVYVGTEETIVVARARGVVKSLEAQGFEVISGFGRTKRRRRD
jgi:hypothetical protein